MNRVTKYIVLVLRNIRAHIWLNLQIIFCFAVLCFMVTLFSVFCISLDATQNSLAENYISANYIVSDTAIDTNGTQAETLTYKVYDCTEATYNALGAELDYLIYSVIQIQCGGLTYTCMQDGNLSICAGESLFTQNDLKEADGQLLYGSYPTSACGICISQNLLECFGIDGGDIIGKTVSISFIKNSAAILTDVTVCGVISSGYYSLHGHNGGADQFAPDIWAAQDCALFTADGGWYTNYVYSFTEWLTESDIQYYKDTYGCKYAGSGVTEDIAVIADMQTIALNLTAITGTATGAGLLLIIYLLTDKYIRQFYIGGGILQACGMCNKELKLLLFLQIIFISLISAALSALLSWAGYAAISYLIYSLLYINLVAPAAWVTVLVFAAGAAAVFITTALFCVFKTHNINKIIIRQMLETKPY
ncbi:MAG: hypothetical protein LUD19_04660 [Clostridia bacterium]|nr:hypothetical protein [Clostridia bacterium]